MMISLFLAAALTAKFDGVAGYSAINLDTGKRVSSNGDVRFPMASVFKVPAAIAVLQKVDRGEWTLDQKITITPAEFSRGWSPIRDAAHGQAVTLPLRELFVSMLGMSDNSAVDKFFTMLGGPQKVTTVLHDLGINGVRVDRKEDEVGRDAMADMLAYSRDPRDTATPDSMADLLRLIAQRKEKLSPASHNLMLAVMEMSMTGPHRLREAMPAGAVLAHKTGSMPGTANDVGIVMTLDGKNRVAIAVFTKASAMSEEDRDAVVRELAAEAWEKVTR